MNSWLTAAVAVLGRFHPLVVHLPIGFLIMAAGLELASRRSRWAGLQPAVGPALLAGSAAALLSVLLGLALAREGGYDADTLRLHQGAGIATTALAVAAWLLKTRPALLKWPILYPGATGIMLILLVLTGHWGGALTHGPDYLTEQMFPAPAPPASMPVADIREARIFDQVIHPVLKSRCESCHRAGKIKGGLRMDTREKLLAGGKHGEVIVPGQSAASELFIRISLPADDDDHMPPADKDQLTEDQVKLLAWWLDAGAPMDQRVGELSVPEDILAIMNAGTTTPETKPAAGFAFQVGPADPAAISALRSRGAMVLPVAQDQPYLQVVAQSDSFGDEDMALLRPLADQVVWLDLRRSGVSRFEVLRELPHLVRLNLAGTPVQDADLGALAGLKYLQYLNLYQTRIGDAGLASLQGLTSLQSLYLWQTQVSMPALTAYRQAQPGVRVVAEATSTDTPPSE
ncbi:MAG: c-type cytochrome domain-containing protein [Bacteroidia bacterium]|nr:c-type cytochrome domain-containing protein [Bacteroidia bacterium]